MNAIDVFSGVGGLSLGAARAGLKIAVAVENDKHAIDIHKRNFRSTVHIPEDVNRISGKELLQAAKLKPREPVALIGGPPCQGFSFIGRRRADDPRNHLFVKFFEIVREIQPAFFLAENVPGILCGQNEELINNAFSFVEGEYNLLRPIVVHANDFGVPTTRKRVLFVGYKDRYFKTITENMISKGTNKKNLVKDAFYGLPRSIFPSWQTEEQGWRKVSYPDVVSAFWKSIKGRIPKGVGDPVSIKNLKDESLVSGFLGTLHTDEVKIRFSKTKPGQIDRISKAARLDWDGYCPTLRSGTASDRGSYQAVRPIHPSAHRVITPREAARLQGFPDWFQFSPTKWHSFRQIGNSVCPTVAEIIIRRILDRRKI